MPTIKVHSKYAAIGNDVLRSKSISLKAKGLLGYLISKPENWNFSAIRIAEEIKEGRDAIFAAIKELELDGLVRREKQANGRVLYHIYSSYELLNVAESGNATQGKSLTGKIHTISNKDTKVKKNKNIPTPNYEKIFNLLTDEKTQELAKKYSITPQAVEETWEIMVTSMLSRGKKYSDWVLALHNWIKPRIEQGKIKKIRTLEEYYRDVEGIEIV